jgi:hypothetical protein
MQIHIIANADTGLSFDLGATYLAMNQRVTVWIPSSAANSPPPSQRERELFSEFGGITRILESDFTAQIGPKDRILCL